MQVHRAALSLYSGSRYEKSVAPMDFILQKKKAKSPLAQTGRAWGNALWGGTEERRDP